MPDPNTVANGKPQIGLYWCASCGGCEETVVDLAEDILGLVAAVDIKLWPVAMDFKRTDVVALPDQSLFATLINGAIRTSEQEEMAHLLRKKSRIIIAFGSCAHLGGIPGLANLFKHEEIMSYVYDQSLSVSNPSGTRPQISTPIDGSVATLPSLHKVVRALNQVIDVDYYIPGCPPPPALVKSALDTLLSGKPPEKGSVLAPDVAMCEQCTRKDTKPADLHYATFHRPDRTKIDLERCMLAQGIICMGPSTRGGCEAVCISGNMPCSGCFGPTSRIRDQGAKMLSAVASSVEAIDEKKIDEILATIPDPVGTFYRYTMPSGLLKIKHHKS
jgi:F420-non-reducing hydrogenase small subunit